MRTSRAAGGMGLLALARKMLTCHISVSLSWVLKEGIPVRRMPFWTFANRVVAHADDAGVVVVRLEQLGSVGVHVVADSGWHVVETVAEGAALNVNAGAGGKGGLIGLHAGANHLLLHA